MINSKSTPPSEAASVIDKAGEQGPKMLAKIFAAAQPGAVYGQPVVVGGHTLITAAEVTSGGGFGVGLGTGPAGKPDAMTAPAASAASAAELGAPRPSGGGAGFGGGGGAMGRPVAVIAIGPDGVTVKPVVDVTKIGLAALTTVAALLGLVRTMRRGGKG